MSFAPYLVAWVILVLAGSLSLLLKRRSIDLATLILLPILLAGWFVVRPDLAGEQSAAFLNWKWAVDSLGWWLTGIVLFLTFIGLAHQFFLRPGGSPGSIPALILGLSAATLPALWAADGYTRVFFITLWGFCFGVFGWLARGTGTIHFRFLIPSAIAVLFLLWLADFSAPPVSRGSTLLAVLVLVGAWPFGAWRSALDLSDSGLALLLPVVPVVVGAAVLGDLRQSATLTAPAILIATGLGLISLLGGFLRLWRTVSPIERVGLALAPALSGLVLMAGIWGGTSVLPAAVQLAVFMPVMAVLLLRTGTNSPLANIPDSSHESERRFNLSLQRIATIAAYLVLAGFPLTVGFRVLASLFDAWIAQNGLLLVLALVILLTLWLAALYLIGRDFTGRPMRTEETENVTGFHRYLVILPLLGLLWFSPAQYAGVAPPTWAILLALPVLGIVLGRFATVREPIADLLPDALSVSLPLDTLRSRLGMANGIAGAAIADALTILEGDYGILWLAGLLLLLFLIS